MGLVSLYMAAECIARLMFEFRARYNCLERLYIGAFFLLWSQKSEKKIESLRLRIYRILFDIICSLIWFGKNFR